MSHGLIACMSLRTIRGALTHKQAKYYKEDAAELQAAPARLRPPSFDPRDGSWPNGCDLHDSDSVRQGYTDRLPQLLVSGGSSPAE